MNIYDQCLNGWKETQWMQGGNDLQTQCIGGRLANQLGYGTLQPAAVQTAEWKHLTDTVREHTGNPYISVQQWNDDPARKFIDIQNLLLVASVKWDLAHPEARQHEMTHA